MKTIILFTFAFINFSLFADESDPSKFCEQSYECTETMSKISAQYENGNSKFSSEKLIAFSGSCYHISPLYHAETEHHGVFVFERTNKGLMANGSFNFFWGYDQYEDMNASQIKDHFIATGTSFDKTMETGNQVELQYLGDESDYHYWFRSEKANKNMFLIAKQASTDYAGFIFCKMSRR